MATLKSTFELVTKMLRTGVYNLASNTLSLSLALAGSHLVGGGDGKLPHEAGSNAEDDTDGRLAHEALEGFLAGRHGAFRAAERGEGRWVRRGERQRSSDSHLHEGVLGFNRSPGGQKIHKVRVYSHRGVWSS